MIVLVVGYSDCFDSRFKFLCAHASNTRNELDSGTVRMSL